MRPRQYVILALALIAAGVCVRLGSWQLSRLEERRALNAVTESRYMEEPVDPRGLPSDTSQIRFRKVMIEGTYDYDHEIALVNRVHGGSPGVHIVTPVRVADTDTVLLVNRGWAYAPDGTTADLSSWREQDTVSDIGFVLPMSDAGVGVPKSHSGDNTFRWLTQEAVKDVVPYPVYPFLAVLTEFGDSTVNGMTPPPRAPMPALDEGSHMSYAVQWFSMAVIFLVGTAIFLRKDLQQRALKD